MEGSFQSREESLREACSIGNTDLVNKLLRDGVDVNSQNAMNGWTSLHWASKRGHGSIISTLLAHQADGNIKNNKGETAYDLASDRNIANCLRSGESNEETNGSVDSSKNDTNGKESRTEDGYTFVPNYLKHPVFPHSQQKDFAKNQEKEIESLRKFESLRKVLEPTPAVVTRCEELVVKVRLVDDMDFIEVELDCELLTFDNLLDVCCKELGVPRESVHKVRKLPNTLVRKDKDVKRLIQFQELELVNKEEFRREDYQL